MGGDDLRSAESVELRADPGAVVAGVAAAAAERADQLDVAVERMRPDVVVLRPQGEIDMSTRDQFGAAIETAVAAGPALAVIDLDGVEFLASSGLAALLEGQRRAVELGVEVALAGGRPATLRVLEITGLLRSFRHCASVEQALDHLG